MHQRVKLLKYGLLFVFEGIDGSGKSTQVDVLASLLADRGYLVLKTYEPTRSEWGMKIRSIAEEGRAGVAPDEELLLFIEDRKQHVEKTILPALREGRIALCDRYYYSSIAYQGALGLDPASIRQMNEDHFRFPVPDRVFMMEIPIETAIGRITRNRPGGANEGYEKREYLQRVKDIFDSMRDPNIVRIDAARPPENVTMDILNAILEAIDGAGNSGDAPACC